MATEFGYLLNAMERAACESNPAKHNYHDKRIAVLGHVSAIEAERDRLRATLEKLREALESIAGGEIYPVQVALDALMAEVEGSK